MTTSIPKPRQLNTFRALLRIFRQEKALKQAESREQAAWANRDRWAKEITIIGKEIVGPRIGAFKSDSVAPEAVTRETRNLIERLEKEITSLRARLN